MLKNLVITSLFLGQALLAAEGDVSTVIKLANTIKSVAQTSETSQENIDEAEVKLREAIELLTSDSSSGHGSSHSGSSDFGACYDFAHQKYYSGLSSSAAADKASTACKGGVDLEITKFLFEKYYSGLSAVNAMDKSAAGSGKNLRGKLTLIKFMYEKYYSGLSSVNAADKAVEGAEKLKKNSLGCLQKLYPNYYSSQSSVNAMNSAVAGCAK
jgi:hypothetical protein